MKGPTNYLVYDYETTTVDPAHAGVMQFGAVRTNSDLDIVGDPINLKVKPGLNYVSPAATLINGIDPFEAQSEGISRWQAAHTIRDEMLKYDDTAISGYNNKQFDDKVTRFLLYQNGLPPYEQEHKDGNQVRDMYHLVQYAHFNKTDALDFPITERETRNGTLQVPGMKLEEVAWENDIPHQAHDALGDVKATVDIAKQIKTNDPESWQGFMTESSRDQLRDLLESGEPVFRINKSGFGVSTVPILPIMENPDRPNEFLGVHLKMGARLEKMVDKYEPEAIEGLMSIPSEERKLMDRFQGLTSDSSRPFTSISLSGQHLVVGARDAIDRRDQSYNVDYDKVEEALDFARSNESRLTPFLESAFDRAPRAPESQASKDLYGSDISRDMKALMAYMSSPSGGEPKVVDNKDVIGSMNRGMGSEQKFIDLMVALKWDNIIKDVDPVSAEKKIQEKLDEGHSPHEVMLYAKLLEQRLTFDDPADKNAPTKDILTQSAFDYTEFARKRPEAMEVNKEIADAAMRYNRTVNETVSTIKEVALRLEFSVDQSLDEKLESNDKNIEALKARRPESPQVNDMTAIELSM